MTRSHRLHHRTEQPVQSVTSAPKSLAEEQAARIKRYLLTMAVRTACFIGAAVTATQGAPWWVWGSLVMGAIVLPYIAVVMANAVAPRDSEPTAPVVPRGDDPDQIER